MTPSLVFRSIGTRLLGVMLLGLGLSSGGIASAAGYADHPGAPALLNSLQRDWGFDAAALAQVRQALTDAQRLPELIKAEQNAAERTETWSTYARKRVDEPRIQRGIEFYRQNRLWLDLAQAHYGVPAEVIVGVLGLETNYGQFTGRARVLDSLATQGFDHPTRTAFFASELLQFFVFCKENGIDPRQPIGSYAGAMGWAQFMPSNYRRLAVDFDEDGDIDLWSAADAIGSIANYLLHYDPQRAWQEHQPIAVAVHLSGAAPAALGVNPKRPNTTVAQLRRLGIEPASPVSDQLDAGLLALTLDNGVEYWAGLPNFYSIMSYNPRVYYAMTVTQLASRIAAGVAAQTSAPPP